MGDTTTENFQGTGASHEEQPFFTVCIPTYNRRRYLKSCVQSAIAAARVLGEPVEICIRDNCSPDGTHDWLQTLAGEDGTVTLRTARNEQNVGAGPNIRRLLADARGRFVYWLTDDDVMLPDALVTAREYIVERDLTYLKCALVTYLERSKSAFFYGERQDVFYDGTDPQAFATICFYCHVLSGTVHVNQPDVRRQLIESSNVYPSAVVFALACERAMLVASPGALHTWENELFWESDVPTSSDRAKAAFLAREFQMAVLSGPRSIAALDGNRDVARMLYRAYGYIERDVQAHVPRLTLAEVATIKAQLLAKRGVAGIASARGRLRSLLGTG